MAKRGKQAEIILKPFREKEEELFQQAVNQSYCQMAAERLSQFPFTLKEKRRILSQLSEKLKQEAMEQD